MTHFNGTGQGNPATGLPVKTEEITLSDEDWAVILYFRQHYLGLDQPNHARVCPINPDKKFFVSGSNKYLRLLFACGPVTQNSRLAKLRTLKSAIDN